MNLTRRILLKSGLGGAAGWLGATSGPASASTPTEDPYVTLAAVNPDPSQRLAIVNADDLGMSEEIDRGIFEALDRGIVTSASLIVDGPHAAEAVRHARQRSDVSLGIHVAFDDRGRWRINMQDPRAVQRELTRQLEAFVRLTGAPPTHIDSHHHAHRLFNVAWQFLEAGARYHVPVRGFSEVFYVGGFWGQPEFGRTDATKISADYLLTVLRSLGPGVSEVSCHPAGWRRDRMPCTTASARWSCTPCATPRSRPRLQPRASGSSAFASTGTSPRSATRACWPARARRPRPPDSG
jgi:predicted glycoside hydrolase/deacetylase ChbG (UPF0249 family)